MAKYGPELIVNGTMEAGDPPTGWTANGTPETFEQSGTQKHGGSYSAHIIDSTASYGGFISNSGGSRVVNNTYKYSFWYFLVSGVLEYDLYNGNFGSALVALAYSTIGSWQQVEGTFIETATGTDGMLIFKNNSNSVATEFYIDDVSLVEVISSGSGPTKMGIGLGL